MNETFLWEEHLPGGSHWSGILRRGNSLRITDLEGGANVSLLMYNADEKLERYNMADTLKAQHTAHLTSGMVCYSDMGRVLCSITDDSVGWHDPIGGVSNRKMVAEKYGVASYQDYRNNYYLNGYDSLLNELAKYGLDARDLVPNINLFSKVVVDESGDMQFVPDNSKSGDYIDLRFEMNTLVVISTCQHALDPSPKYQPIPVQLSVWHSGVAPEVDACRDRCAENKRGFMNTDRLYL